MSNQDYIDIFFVAKHVISTIHELEISMKESFFSAKKKDLKVPPLFLLQLKITGSRHESRSNNESTKIFLKLQIGWCPSLSLDKLALREGDTFFWLPKFERKNEDLLVSYIWGCQKEEVSPWLLRQSLFLMPSSEHI